jgi:ribulose-phosphate 3-epimerase
MSASPALLAPSILAADFARLGEQVRAAEQAGANRIHVDVMDGHFVPNLSMGPEVVKALRPVTTLPLETHLMIEEPDRYVDPFLDAGSDRVLVHIENSGDLIRRLRHVHSRGKSVGVVLNPETPPDGLPGLLPEVDLVLVMTVHPGFGGQAFIQETLSKIRVVRDMIDRLRPGVELEVDGGIDAATAPLAYQAGARVFVAGSSIFHVKEGVAAGMKHLRQALAGAGAPQA